MPRTPKEIDSEKLLEAVHAIGEELLAIEGVLADKGMVTDEKIENKLKEIRKGKLYNLDDVRKKHEEETD